MADASGAVVRSEVVDGSGPSLMPDFPITREHVVFINSPVVFDHAEHSGIPYRWHDDVPLRIGVMPRAGGRTTWFEVPEQAALLHVTNAYTDGQGRIVLEAPRFDRSAWEGSWKWWVGAPGYGTSPDTGSTFHRWTVDPIRGKVTTESLNSLATEFPSINEAHTGSDYRFSYAIAFPGAGLSRYHTATLDSRTGRKTLLAHGEGRMPGEAVFVPARGGTAEDDGYLLTLVSDVRADASELLVLDAGDLTTVAAVELPRRVPAGIPLLDRPGRRPLPHRRPGGVDDTLNGELDLERHGARAPARASARWGAGHQQPGGRHRPRGRWHRPVAVPPRALPGRHRHPVVTRGALTGLALRAWRPGQGASVSTRPSVGAVAARPFAYVFCTRERSVASGTALVQAVPALDPDISWEHGPGLVSGRPRLWPSSCAAMRVLSYPWLTACAPSSTRTCRPGRTGPRVACGQPVVATMTISARTPGAASTSRTLLTFAFQEATPAVMAASQPPARLSS